VLRSRIGVLFFAIFLAYFLTCVIVFVPGALAMTRVYTISSQFLQIVERSLAQLPNHAGSRELLMRRTLKSLPPLKSRITGLYYMESKAKLTLFDNVVHGIAFMMTTFQR
jgi:hypothetical protein